MSDSIIRLSGTRINDAVSVHNLITHIGNSNSRKLIIVSAIPEILMSIYYAIENVSEIDVDDLMNKLKSICIDKTQHDVHANYISITGQVGAIVKGIQLTGDYSVS